MIFLFVCFFFFLLSVFVVVCFLNDETRLLILIHVFFLLLLLLSLYCYCLKLLHTLYYFILLNSFFFFFMFCCPYNISLISFNRVHDDYHISLSLFFLFNVVIRLHTSFIFSLSLLCVSSCFVVGLFSFFAKKDLLYNFKKKKEISKIHDEAKKNIQQIFDFFSILICI